MAPSDNREASLMSSDTSHPIRFRMRHTMLPVADIDRSVDFYTRLLGMRVLRRRADPAQGRTIAYVGYGDEASSTVLELIATGSEPVAPWAGHIAVAVSDLKALCARLEADGVAFAMPLTEVNNSSSRYQANIYDPDRFMIELNELKTGVGT